MSVSPTNPSSRQQPSPGGFWWPPPGRYMQAEPVSYDIGEHPHSDSLVDLAYTAAADRLTEQRARLEGIRTRAAALLSVAALVITFSTGTGLFDPAAGPELHPPGIVFLLGLVFLGVGICAVCVLQPTPPSWAHGPRAEAILDHCSGLSSATAVKAAEAGYMAKAADTFNRTHLDFCSWWYRRGAALLGVELLIVLTGAALARV
ncbi:hypothetical protein ACPCSC_25360 [Streptomyces lavendulocolor]|uniref:hypothetical protein n=1 Tax=Streptomyces lavendulocolor TaxID=67316 RepID=UPI003C306E9F